MTGGGAVLGLGHVGLGCADLERALKFDCRTLGIPVRDRGELVWNPDAPLTSV